MTRARALAAAAVLGATLLAGAPARAEPDGGQAVGEARAMRHVVLARRLLEMGEHARALAEVDQALLIAPSADAYALQGEVLSALVARRADSLAMRTTDRREAVPREPSP